MSEEIKAEHRLVEVSEAGPSDWPTFRWLCACGEHEHGYVSENVARDAHAEHAQESGEYGLPDGFVVANAEHDKSCKDCQGLVRKAVQNAIDNDRQYGIAEIDERMDAWDGPEITHWVRVSRRVARS